MTWSFQVGKILGIPIRLHLTFVLLIGWLGVAGTAAGNVAGFLLAVGLFGCVLAHELGHSVVARHYGVRVTDITLLPIGGVARLATMPDTPRQEFWIAVAGPAVNVVLAPLFYGLHLLLETPLLLEGWQSPAPLLETLSSLNVMLAVFNLIPAFPMDGGRILRALLAEHMAYSRATHIAASCGQLAAIALGFGGLYWHNIWLMLIGLFVFIGAAEENSRVHTHTVLADVPVRAAMITHFDRLRRADTVGTAVDLLLAGSQTDLPVVEDGRTVGILTRPRLLAALAESGRERYVSEVMEPAPSPVSLDTPLEKALQRLATEGAAMLPVEDDDGLHGLVTVENISEFVLVRTALHRGRERRAHGIAGG